MSSISVDIPTFQINQNDIENLVDFISSQEQPLKHFGAIKIELNNDCQLALKKRQKNLLTYPINKQIVKMNKDDLIYNVQKLDHIDEAIEQSSFIYDENTFWSKLSSLNNEQRYLNISFIPNKSFFCQKVSRMYFDLHLLPSQSILKIAGKKVLSQFVPCIKRAHQAGAIFPLSCTQQNLFSIDYHHEGGNRHWYIIPISQRKQLQTIIHKQNSSICLDHGQILIDPSFLDRNQIRYHRIVQHPNEFVVLSAGTLAQSFTCDASWSESIEFALPSWIEDGHANISTPSCQCNVQQGFLSEPIDVNLFQPDLIQKYIQSTSKNIHYDKSGDEGTDVSTPSSTTTDSSNDETMMSTYRKLRLPRQRRLPSNPFITPSVSTYFSEDEEDRQDSIQDAFDKHKLDTVLIDSILSKHLSELGTRKNQPSIAPTNARHHFTKNCNLDNEFLFDEDLMDVIPSATNAIESAHIQADEHLNRIIPSTLLFNTETTAVNEQRHTKTNGRLTPIINGCKTLFVSGLRSGVNKNDLYTHFKGCIKVTIKQYRTTPHFKYAFILHRTSKDAESNLQRPIDFHLFGPHCQIECADSRSALLRSRQSFDSKKIVVQQIPPNVSENDLRNLFANCHIITYCPAVNIPLTPTMMKTKTNSHILPGYAYIRLNDKQDVAHVIKHTDQYQIHGQSLAISLFRN